MGELHPQEPCFTLCDEPIRLSHEIQTGACTTSWVRHRRSHVVAWWLLPLARLHRPGRHLDSPARFPTSSPALFGAGSGFRMFPPSYIFSQVDTELPISYQCLSGQIDGERDGCAI